MIVGEADLDVHARTDHVDDDLRRDLNVIASRAGERFGSLLGRGIGAPLRFAARRAGVGAGDDLNSVAGRIGTRFGTAIGRAVGAPFRVLFRRNVSDVAERESHAAGARSGRSFSVGLRSILGGAAIIGGIRAVGGQLRAGFDEWASGVKGLAQLQSRLKSTGNVVGLTTDQLGALSKRLQDQTGIDDDLVTHAEGLLLTFTRVRDVAGQGNDVFSQGITLARDLSVRGFGDLNATSLQLGKALNDPIKGVGALSRAGIQFSAGQRETIRTMIENGDLLGAQKIILGEVTKEVGGSAKAFGKTLPGQLSIAKERFANLRGELVGKLAPAMLVGLNVVNRGMDLIEKYGPRIEHALAPAVTFVREKLVEGFHLVEPVVARVFGSFGEGGKGSGAVKFLVGLWKRELTPIVRGAVSAFHSVSDAIERNRDRFSRLGSIIVTTFRVVAPIIADLVGGVIGKTFVLLGQLLGDLIDIVARVGGAFVKIIPPILDVTGSLLSAIGTLVSGALSLFDKLLGGIASVADAFGLHGVADGIRKARAQVDEYLGGIADDLGAAAVQLHLGANAVGQAIAGGVKEGLLAQAANDPELAAALATITGAPAGIGISPSELDGILKTAKETGGKVRGALADGLNGGTASAPSADGLLDDTSKKLKDAQKTAADRARALGNAVTQGLRSQLTIVKREVSTLTTQRNKILDFRSSVLSAAGSFTKLSDLIDDPSTSTAGRIERALNNRLLGLQTFAKNLQTLAKRGLDKGVIAELALGGPEQRALSSALVAGTDAQIKQLNATEKAVRQQQQVVAAVGTDAAFGPNALAKTNTELARLNTQVAALNKQIAAQPALIAKAVDAARKNATVSTKTSTRTAVAK